MLISEIVTMESLYDVEVEEIDNETFEFDGSPYLFVPEYTDERILALEIERGAESGTGRGSFTGKHIGDLVVLLWMLCPNEYRRGEPML